MIDPNTVRDVEVLPFRVGGIERHPALPILGIGVGMEDLGTGIALFAAIEEAAPGTGDRIKAVAVAEWCIGIGGGDLLLMLQARPANSLRKAGVDLDANGADMRVQAVDDYAVLLILIEPQIQKSPRHAAALRGAVHQGIFNGALQRVRHPGTAIA
jgi:hypothetical protein